MKLVCKGLSVITMGGMFIVEWYWAYWMGASHCENGGAKVVV
jgi:hypothetical protein